MARKESVTHRPTKQTPLRLPAVEAAARRLEELVWREQQDPTRLDNPTSNDLIGVGDIPLSLDSVFDSEPPDVNCSIALFHPTTEPYAQHARNWIIPLLDGYGRVTRRTDSCFESSGQSEGVADAGWRQNVGDFVNTLDVAVVDTSNITGELLWMIETCYRYLPPDRVIIIAYATSDRDLRFHAENLSKILAARHIDRRPEPLLAYAANGDLGRFAETLDRRMRDIVAASAALYEQALESAENADDHHAMMRAYRDLGEVAYNLGTYRSALDWFRLALVMAATVGDRAALRTMHLRLQAAAAAEGDDDQWLESFEALGDMAGWKIPDP